MDDKSLILECDVEDTPQGEVMRIKLEDEESTLPHTANNPFLDTTDIPSQTAIDTTYGPNKTSINTTDITDSTIGLSTYSSTTHTLPSTTHTPPSTTHTPSSTTHTPPTYAPIQIEPQAASEIQDEDHKEPQGTESYSLFITSEDGSVQEVLIDITMESNDTEQVYPDRDNVEEENLPQTPGTHTDSQIPGTHTDSQADLSTTREEHTTGIQLEIVKKEYDSEGTELEGDINTNVCSADQNPPGESPWAVTAGDVTADELAVFDTAHATKDEPHLEAGSDDQQDNKSDSTNPPNNRSDSENATDPNSEKPYVCDVCGKGFTKLRSVKLHQRVHSLKETKQHVCEVCNKHFSRPCLLKQHRLFHSKEELHLCMHLETGTDDQPDNKSGPENHSDTNSEKPYVCDICGKGFTQLRSMKLHQRIHSGKETMQHICEVCNKHFSRPCYLKKHMLVHSKETKKKYVCEVCNKPFRGPFHLDVHMAVHSKEKPHQCNVCGKRFSHITYLSAHKRIHSGYRPHKCDVCGWGFMKMLDLQRHKVVHTGERPYQCKICAKYFRHKFTLVSHIKTHTKPCPPCCKQACGQNHVQGQQYQQTATVCHEQVIDNQDAAIVGKEQVSDNQDAATVCKEEVKDDQHTVPVGGGKVKDDQHTIPVDKEEVKVDQHTVPVGREQVMNDLMQNKWLTTAHCKHCVVVNPHKCPICGKCFPRSYHLKVHHDSKHRGWKPHKCSICGKGFTRRYHVKSHMVTHSKLKPFKCFLCDTDFKTTSSLKFHQLHCVARPIRCSMCGHGFANAEELHKHFESKHTAWNQCTCDGCGQHIDSPSLLKSHKLTCSGKPRFKCQVCNKALSSNKGLKDHMNIHVVIPLVL